jgi:antitoxin component of MazEF toxin-antitoxin module
MQVTIKKWGNSLAARLPKAIVESSQLSLNQTVDIEVIKGRVVLSPIRKTKGYSLDELLAQCEPEAMVLDDEDRKGLNAAPKGRELL